MKTKDELNAIRRDNYKKNKDKILKQNKKWRDNNPEKYKESYTLYRTKHKDKFVESLKKYYNKNKEKKAQYNKEYRLKNQDKLKKYMNEYVQSRAKTDLDFKLKNSLRDRLRKAIKGNYKSGSAVNDLGCSIQEFKQYLESKFQSGMTWENYGRYGWHIDHIRPLANFNLLDINEFKQAVHYTNLQPLWAEENLKKQDKYVKVS